MKRWGIAILVMCLIVGIMGCSTGTSYSPSSVEEPKFPSYRDYSNFGFEDMKSGEYSTLMQITGYSISGYTGDGDSYVFVAKSNSYGYDYSTIEIAGSTLKVIDYDKTEEKIYRGTDDHTQDVHKYDLDVLDNDVLTYEAFNFSDYGGKLIIEERKGNNLYPIFVIDSQAAYDLDGWYFPVDFIDWDRSPVEGVHESSDGEQTEGWLYYLQ